MGAIEQMLFSLGFRPTHKGFAYLVYAINLARKTPVK